MFSFVYGSHTEQAYSSGGRTRDLYACSFDCGGTDINVPTEKPKCLVCLCCNAVYMATGIPFKIRLYSDTKIFGFICMFKLVSM
jgi:hypothetical protein